MKRAEELEKMSSEFGKCDVERKPYTGKTSALQSTTTLEEKEADSEDDNDYEAKESYEGLNGTGRTVTLQTLMSANVLQPGKSLMTIDYLGQKFVGDLMPDGKIKSHETETVFLTPSAWAVHCKRIINPDKKSGCGWASVKYKGKKLDAYKSSWLRKCALQKDISMDDSEPDADKKLDFLLPVIKRVICPYNTIINRNFSHDGNMLIKAVSFTSMGKVQPFLVTFNSSALFLADFHCHLTMREVCGYFGGHWDINTHTLSITKTYPCRNTRFDRQNAAEEERNTQQRLNRDQLLLVGWYHSHPKFQAEPSLRDCETQLDFQTRMRGSSDVTYIPCISTIISPYYEESPTLESVIKSIWIMPPNETKQMLEYGRPMLMQYSILSDKELPKDVRCEVQACVDYYSLYRNELVKFCNIFNDGITFIEKLKNTLYSKFPMKSDNKDLWNWICEVLGCAHEEDFIPPKTIKIIDNNTETISPPSSTDLLDEMRKESYNTKNVNLDLTDEKLQIDKKYNEMKVLSLQEQLCLPSGLNMNPVRTFTPLAIPNPIIPGNTQILTVPNAIISPTAIVASSVITTPCTGLLSPLPPPETNANNTIAPTLSLHAAEVSLHDSPITVPSSSASPAKLDLPVQISPSPPKSETVSCVSRKHNSPAPSPGNINHGTHNNNLNIGSNKYDTELTPIPQSGVFPSNANDLVAASLAQLAGQVTPNFLQTDLVSLFQQQSTHKNYGNSSLNQLAAAAEKAGEKNDPCDTVAVADYSKVFTIPRIQDSIVQNQTMPSNSKNKIERSKVSSVSSNTSNLYKTKLMKELDNLKNDPLKITELMRSPEYAALLLHQAEALGATTLGTLGLGADLNFLTGTSFSSKTPNSDTSLTADYNNLVQVSKMLGYDSCMQLAKSDDLNTFLQQQMGAVAAAALVNVSLSSSLSTSKKQKPPDTQPQSQTEYSSLLQTYSKLFETENNFRVTTNAGKTNNAHQELSALLATGVGLPDNELSGFDSKQKSKDMTIQIHQKQNENLNKIENTLFYHQNKVSSDLNALFATSSASTSSVSPSNKHLNSSTISANVPTLTDPAIYYNAFAQEKPQDYSSFFHQQQVKHDSNFFISPAAMIKIQKDSFSAMMMKPPKSTSTSLASLSRTRESSTSPALGRLTPTKSGIGCSNTSNSNNLKYNFSAVDLAVSSIQSNTSTPVPLDVSTGSLSHRRPSNTPPVDLSRLYSEMTTPLGVGSVKKRMEFSSIADLAAPPPTKISKVNEDILGLSNV